jgi:predicted DNA-binding protein (MmcQ/YjbR family)
MPPADPVHRLRKICLAFAEAHEVEAWGEPTFRVKNKMFAMFASTGTHHTTRPAVWIKSRPANQALVLASRPDRYFSPPYVGKIGWIGAWLDRRPPWGELAVLIEDGYRTTAPRRLLAQNKVPSGKS